MKRNLLITVCLMLALTVVLCVPALASDAADVAVELDKVQGEFSDNHRVLKLIDDAQRWLSKKENAATITPEAAKVIKSEINAALAAVGDASAMSQLSPSQRNAVLGSVATAATAAGLNFEASADYSSFVLKDPNGNVISSIAFANPIKQTGAETSLAGIGAIGAAILLIAGFAAIIYIKAPAEPARRSSSEAA